jgi:hypothetical protein
MGFHDNPFIKKKVVLMCKNYDTELQILKIWTHNFNSIFNIFNFICGQQKLIFILESVRSFKNRVDLNFFIFVNFFLHFLMVWLFSKRLRHTTAFRNGNSF